DGAQIDDGTIGASKVDDSICKADGTDCPADADTWCGSGQTCDPADVGLAALGDGEAWVGSSYTPTDVATQEEFDVVASCPDGQWWIAGSQTCGAFLAEAIDGTIFGSNTTGKKLFIYPNTAGDGTGEIVF